MKVYIPTSSLNFNNILSSESVSPRRFYAQRHFGYPRWEPVPENPYDDVILLYREPHGFSRPPSDMEDHPLLIELEVDADAFPEWQDGVLFSDRTIYLDPVSAVFVFFTEQDKTVALSLSMSSMESKVLRLYRKRITVNTFVGEFPQLQENRNARERICPVETEINRDRRINKIKGMLYGYYIGAYLSCSRGNVERMTALRAIGNAFASILSSESRSPTPEQRKRLECCFGLLLRGTKEYQCLQPREEDEIIDILQKLSKAGHSDVLPFDKVELIEGLRRDLPTEENPSLKWVEGELSRQEQKMCDERRLLEVAKGELVSCEGKVVKVTSASMDGETERQLFLAWTNDTLLRQEFTGKISAEQTRLADELTIKAKDVLADSWADSAHKVFLNQLRRRVRGEQFRPEWDNGVLSSIAAVVLKGDDWNVLLRFMQDCGMTDYRNAFAFYGCLNGFANLTRDFTDLILKRDTQYVMHVYSEFHKQLHGRRIDWEKLVSTLGVKPSDEPQRPVPSGLRDWLRGILNKILPTLKAPKSKRDKEDLSKVFNQLVDKCDSEQGFMSQLPSQKGWGRRTNAYKAIKNEMDQFESRKRGMVLVQEELLPDGDCNVLANKTVSSQIATIQQQNASRMQEVLLCDDKDLVSAIQNEFPNEQSLSMKVQRFSSWYHPPEGLYYKRGDIRKNPELINHLMSCFHSRKAEELNHRFTTPEEEERFVSFLEKRYNCKRQQR